MLNKLFDKSVSVLFGKIRNRNGFLRARIENNAIS